MRVKYELKGYADQSVLTDEQQKLMNDYVEAIDGYIVLKFNKLLVEEEENDIIVDIPQNFIYEFDDNVGEGHGSNRGKYVIKSSSGGNSKFSYPNQGKWLAHDILAGLESVFLPLLAVGAALL